MEIEITAAGVPDKINADVATQLKQGKNSPEWPLYVAFRDAIARVVAAQPGGSHRLSARISIQLEPIPADVQAQLTSPTRRKSDASSSFEATGEAITPGRTK